MSEDSVKKIDEIRIGVLGNVDSGKTTLISVISNNILDNGRGLARKKVLKHNHEQETGRTSSITHTYHYSKDDNRIVSFIDLAGHEKYYKTTVFGANCCSLDYIMLLVGANMGVSLMTREHFLLILILKLPFIIVVTKMDLAPENVLENTIADIKLLISKYKPNYELLEMCSDNLHSLKNFNPTIDNKVPIFKISNTNAFNLDILKQFLYSLNIYNPWLKLRSESLYFTIEDVYTVNGTGLVITGTQTSGIIKKGNKVMLGPINGNFVECLVKSIHNNFKELVEQLDAGCSGCFCVKSLEKKVHLKRDNVKRGMVVVSKDCNNFTYKTFEAKIKILHHPTTIKKNYEPIVHCGSIRQTAKIVDIEQDLLRTGDQSIVKFEFKSRPEFIQLNKQIMFREGKTKGIGVVTKLVK